MMENSKAKKVELTPSQAIAEQGLLKAYAGGSTKVVGLWGAPGFGKSFLLTEVLPRLTSLNRVVFTAPTNTACKLLAKDLPAKATVTTIYKLFKLRVTDDDEVRYAASFDEIDLEDMDIVVLDEASMCGSGLYEKWLEAREKFPDVFWIIAGDDYQLRPVKDIKSKFITEAPEQEFTLSDSVRMHPDSPVLATGLAIRTLIDENYRGNIIFEEERSKHGNIYVTKMPRFHDAFKKAVMSENYSVNNIVATAYTNRRVQALNTIAHAAKFGEDAPKWLVGETVTLTSPLETEDGKTISVDTFLLIQDITKGHYSRKPVDICSKAAVRCDRLTVCAIQDKGKPVYVIDVPDQEEGEEVFNSIVQDLKAKAREQGTWPLYYRYHDSVAHLRHLYAVTAHKLQGRTVNDTVFVDAIDIQHPRYRPKDYKNLLNVAITRTRKDVIIVQ